MVDLRLGELRKHGIRLKLGEQPLQILILLLQRQGDLVTREELQAKLWANDTFVDFDHSLNSAVQRLRDCLADSAGKARWVETIPRRGYRFAGQVEWSSKGLAAENGAAPLVDQEDQPNAHSQVAPAPAAPSSVPPHAGASARVLEVPEAKSPDRNESAPAKRSHRWRLAVPALVLCLLGAALLGFDAGGVRDRLTGGSRRPQIHSIAVLPLANFSGDASQEYFADGMTDELITELAKNRSLLVVSRTSVMQYKGARRPLREIARELGVDGILEGSVARSGNNVHMTVQLIYAPTDTHIWADTYDRDLNRALLLPQELSQVIAGEARVGATPVRQRRYISAEAHDAYLHGRYVWFEEGAYRSREYFEKAIQVQPDYAAAWSGLADCYVGSMVEETPPGARVVAEAKAAAQRAVELDDSLPEAHNSMAAASFFLDWDLARANAESLRAIELNPNYAEARHLHSYVLGAMNRTDEALAEQKQSTEIDPFARPWALALAYLRARQYDAAVGELRLRSEARPGDGDTHLLLFQAYHFKGMSKESIRELEEGMRLTMGKEAAAAAHRAFERGGEAAVGNWWLNYSKASAKEKTSAWQFAELYAMFGHKEEALEYLEQAYREHSPRLVFLQNEPCYDFLHSDPRYRALVRKIGLPPAY